MHNAPSIPRRFEYIKYMSANEGLYTAMKLIKDHIGSNEDQKLLKIRCKSRYAATVQI